ncbi:IS1096 element passenger TnpR family protein [Corynebacterium sp.]|uniref:IS1096 element passenger TnpR family protein n=1 Tax=Corynebacterium sp. TaxID=1720 RepID=UPI002A9105FB|nr:hypothetical protein [Corynebacterium sp.]MDY5785340.1 hypothetical protein [Corynebacterium sp.]
MIVSLLATVEKSQPVMSRLVNVEDSMNLGELSQVIDAAFGFSGAATHLYMGPAREGTQREVLSATPGAGERNEKDVTISQIGHATYVYDPSANWNIHVEVLGRSHLDGPTPTLIDALGPDVVESCNGPTMMSRFHVEARRITAGLDPDMEVAPLLLSFLPVMTPERLLRRLTQADQVTVSERISFVAEDMFIGATEAMGEDPRAPRFAAEFEEYLESRPDLREILSMDPNPERNPTLISAMAEFFEERLGDGGADSEFAVYDSLTSIIEMVWSQPRKRIKLTSLGTVPATYVAALAVMLDVPGTEPQIEIILRALIAAGLLAEVDGWLTVTARGEDLLENPNLFAETVPALRDGFRLELGEGWDALLRQVEHASSLTSEGTESADGAAQAVAIEELDDDDSALLHALGVLAFGDEFGGECFTVGGIQFVQRMLDRD